MSKKLYGAAWVVHDSYLTNVNIKNIVEWSFDVEKNQGDSWLLAWIKYEKSLAIVHYITLADSTWKSCICIAAKLMNLYIAGEVISKKVAANNKGCI